MASAGTIRKNLPTSIASAPVTLYQSVLPVSPANAEPLLLACEVNAYTTSLRPCGPGFRIDALAGPIRTEAALNTRTSDRDGEQVQHDELHLGRLDLLAQVLRACARP